MFIFTLPSSSGSCQSCLGAIYFTALAPHRDLVWGYHHPNYLIPQARALSPTSSTRNPENSQEWRPDPPKPRAAQQGKYKRWRGWSFTYHMLLFSTAVQCTGALALLAGWSPSLCLNTKTTPLFLAVLSVTVLSLTLWKTHSQILLFSVIYSVTYDPLCPHVKDKWTSTFWINAGLSSAFNFSRLSRPIDSASHAFCLPSLHSSRPEDNRRGLASFFWHLKDRKVSCLCGWYCCQMELHTNLALLLRNALSPKWKKVSQQPGKKILPERQRCSLSLNSLRPWLLGMLATHLCHGYKDVCFPP